MGLAGNQPNRQISLPTRFRQKGPWFWEASCLTRSPSTPGIGTTRETCGGRAINFTNRTRRPAISQIDSLWQPVGAVVRALPSIRGRRIGSGKAPADFRRVDLGFLSSAPPAFRGGFRQRSALLPYRRCFGLELLGTHSHRGLGLGAAPGPREPVATGWDSTPPTGGTRLSAGLQRPSPSFARQRYIFSPATRAWLDMRLGLQPRYLDWTLHFSALSLTICMKPA